MALAATEPQLKAALLALVTTAASGKVWGRIRFAKSDADYKLWYVDGNNRANVWFVRRTAPVGSEVDGIPPSLISETHTYELRYFTAIVDSDVDGEDSETFMQLEVENVRAAINADFTLDFDPGVSHSGVQIGQMPAVAQLGDYAGHMAVCTVAITVSEC